MFLLKKLNCVCLNCIATVKQENTSLKFPVRPFAMASCGEEVKGHKWRAAICSARFIGCIILRVDTLIKCKINCGYSCRYRKCYDTMNQ